MMDVEVEELCTNTVTSIPTTSPATGLDRMAFSWKISPATLPGRERPIKTDRLEHCFKIQSQAVHTVYGTRVTKTDN